MSHTRSTTTQPVFRKTQISIRRGPALHTKLALFCFALGAAALVTLTGQAQVSLTNGVSQERSLAAGMTDSYSITANAGDRVVLQLAKLSGGAAFTPVISLWTPDGTRLVSDVDSLAPRLDVQAPVAGDYALAVADATGTGGGNYRVLLAQVPGSFTTSSGDEGGSLTNGVIHEGAIDAGDLDLWTTSAEAGDRITVQIAETSGGAGFTPVIELFAPDGTRLAFEADNLVARVDVQAIAAGTYTVLVSDAQGGGTGGYQLQLARVPDTITVPTGDEGGPLTDATDTDGTIAMGDLDLWSFNADAGDRVVVELTETAGGANFAPQIELFAPSGEPKTVAQGALSATLDVAIEASGSYTLLVSDANQIGAGSYQLRLSRSSIGPSESNTLTNGATALGEIASAGETNRWSFTASVGDNLVVRVGETTASSALVPWLRLYNPDGVLLGQDFSGVAAEVAVRATNSGTFLVIVSDGSSAGTRTGGYRINLAKTGSMTTISATDEGGSLTNGTTVMGTIETGDLDVWTFTASAGENFVVRSGETTASSPWVPWLRLYGPNGVFLGQDFSSAAAEVTTQATNTGTFMVVVGDGTSGLGATGNYRINLAKTGGQPTILPTDEGGSMTNGMSLAGTIDTGDLDAWTFTANVGESFVVRIGETTDGSPLLPWLRLYGPDGVFLGHDFSSVAAEVTTRATNSGTFLVVVGDGTSGRGASGNYRLSLAKTGSQPTISATDEGGPMVNGTTHLGAIETGDIDAWTFTAAPNESIVVRIGETTDGSPLLPWLRLYGPDGVFLGHDFSSVAAEVTTRATNSGTFLVVVGDGTSGRGAAGNYRLTLAKTGNEPTISPTDEGGPMVNGTTYVGAIDIGDIDAWTLTANSNETVLVRIGEVTEGSPLLPWLRLYGPDGALLGHDFSSAAAEVTTRATNSGTFLVVVGDGTSGRGATGNYRLSLAKTVSPLVISTGDEGGSLNGAAEYIAAIDIGDIDTWAFTACAGDIISIEVAETVSGSPLFPRLRLYGTDGVRLRNEAGSANASVSNFRAPASGTYLVVVGDGTSGLGGTGTYTLSVNGLTDGLKVCPPRIAGANALITGIGGTASGPFILLSSTDLTEPLSLWSAIATNQFDQFGVTVVTNAFDPDEAHRFFTLQVP